MTQTQQELIDRSRQQWNRTAPAWGKWADVFAQRNDGPQYLELAHIQPGQRVLEIGAGTGDQTLLLAEAVGQQGEVVATDLSQGMLDIIQARVDTAGYRNVELLAGHAGSISVDDGSFDAAVAGLVLMLVPEPEEVAAAVRQKLAPGGRFVASVWSPPPAVPMLSLPMMAVLAEVGGGPPDMTGPGLFALADQARLAQVLTSAGFADVAVTPFTFSMTFASAAQFRDFVREVTPPLSQLIAERAPGKADAAWNRVEAIAQQHADDGGTVTFQNEMLFATGTRPGAR